MLAKASNALICALLLSLPVVGQEERSIQIRGISPNNGGLGVVLALPTGEPLVCYLKVTKTRSQLFTGGTGPAQAIREVAVGSAEEQRILDAFEQWIDEAFTEGEEAEYLAREHHPNTRVVEMSQELAREIWFLRDLRYYQEVSRPKIDKVFAGRGTVSLSLEQTLGSTPPQILLWRRLDEDEFARLYIASEAEPVAVDSALEIKLLLGMANWLAERIGGHDALWEGDAVDADEDVQNVLRAFRGYMVATSPRLRSTGVIMDRARGGSRRFDIADERNRQTRIRFDHAFQTETPGRLYADRELVEIGSEREAELLELARRTAELRRRWRGDDAEDDNSLRLLEEELEGYLERFHRREPGSVTPPRLPDRARGRAPAPPP